MATVQSIPDGYPRVIPYLSDGAGAAIDFYAHVFGATEKVRCRGRTARSATLGWPSATR